MIPSRRLAVVGAGAFGSWIALQAVRLAPRRFSSIKTARRTTCRAPGGSARIIRLAYGPDEIYTLLANRSLELWKAFFLCRKSTRLFPPHRRPVDGKRGRVLNSRGAGSLPPSSYRVPISEGPRDPNKPTRKTVIAIVNHPIIRWKQLAEMKSLAPIFLPDTIGPVRCAAIHIRVIGPFAFDLVPQRGRQATV